MGDTPVPLGVDIGISISVRDFKGCGNQDVLSPRGLPILPPLYGESEHGVAGKYSYNIDLHRLKQVVINISEHLVGFMYLYRTLFQPIDITEFLYDATMDTSDCCRPKIYGNRTLSMV